MICVWQVFGDIQDFTYIADSQTCEVVESHRISSDLPPINVPPLELEFYP